MYWIGLFVVGLVVGLVAKLLMPGKDPGGFIVTALLGIAGMFLGNWLAGVFGVAIGGALAGFIAGVIGAVILLFAYRVASRKR